jgi:hypothetical protein
MFKRRPKFTDAQRLQLDLLIGGELSYLEESPEACLFTTEQEAADLLRVIRANSEATI